MSLTSCYKHQHPVPGQCRTGWRRSPAPAPTRSLHRPEAASEPRPSRLLRCPSRRRLPSRGSGALPAQLPAQRAGPRARPKAAPRLLARRRGGPSPPARLSGRGVRVPTAPGSLELSPGARLSGAHRRALRPAPSAGAQTPARRRPGTSPPPPPRTAPPSGYPHFPSGLASGQSDHFRSPVRGPPAPAPRTKPRFPRRRVHALRGPHGRLETRTAKVRRSLQAQTRPQRQPITTPSPNTHQ